MRLSILGKDSKTKDEKPLGVVDAYVKENTTELVDPLDVKKKPEALEENRISAITKEKTDVLTGAYKETLNILRPSNTVANPGFGWCVLSMEKRCG